MTRRHLRLAALASLAVVTLAITPGTASAAEPVDWVALGDSYTAGVFVGTPQLPVGGDEPRDGCDRTTNSYPDVVEQRLDAAPPSSPVTLTNVSCGNATIKDVFETRQKPISPVQPPSGGWPEVSPQLARAAVSDATDVITVGVGGNSLPLGSIVATCLLLGAGHDDDETPCRDAYEQGHPIFAPETIRDIFQRIFREYAELLETVHERAPSASVITIGYPTIFPENADMCDRSNTSHFAAVINDTPVSMTRGDIAWLHGVVTELNAIIEDVTDLVDYDYVYVDTATSSVGHDVCRPAGTKWVEGICGEARTYWPTELTLGTPPLTFTLACSDGARATIVHPNQNGYLNTATHVERAIRAAISTRLTR